MRIARVSQQVGVDVRSSQRGAAAAHFGCRSKIVHQYAIVAWPEQIRTSQTVVANSSPGTEPNAGNLRTERELRIDAVAIFIERIVGDHHSHIPTELDKRTNLWHRRQTQGRHPGKY